MKSFFLIFSLLFLCGCQPTPAPEAPTSQSARSLASGESTAPSTPATSEGIEANSSGSPLTINVPGYSDKARLSTSSTGAITLDDWTVLEKGGEIIIDKAGATVAKAKQNKNKWHLISQSGKELAVFKAKDDDGFKVTGPGGALMVKVKSRDYGWKATGSKEEELLKVRLEDKHIKVKNANGDTINKVPNSGQSLVYTWLSIPSLPLEVRLAMAYITKDAQHG